MSRYKWFQKKYLGDKELTLEQFWEYEDQLTLDPDYRNSLREETGGKVREIVYNDGEMDDFIGKIMKKDFGSYGLVRPDWDTYFMRMAHVAATRSNCMKRSVGAIVVNSDKQIVATGYNGTTFGYENCFEGGCDRWNDHSVSQGEQLDLWVCIHAEENAILIAGRTNTRGWSVYVTAFPWALWAKFMLQAGIKNVYYDSEYKGEISKKLFAKCNIGVKRVSPFASNNKE